MERCAELRSTTIASFAAHIDDNTHPYALYMTYVWSSGQEHYPTRRNESLDEVASRGVESTPYSGLGYPTTVLLSQSVYSVFSKFLHTAAHSLVHIPVRSQSCGQSPNPMERARTVTALGTQPSQAGCSLSLAACLTLA
jgi:hypothetical protein